MLHKRLKEPFALWFSMDLVEFLAPLPLSIEKVLGEFFSISEFSKAEIRQKWQ